jgi:hypothetical protein
MSGRGVRTKGAAGEREAAAVLEDLWGRAWRRSASQSQGATRAVQEPDIVLVEPAMPWEAAQGPEVKRCESADLWAWMRQAQGDSDGTARIPWVMWRPSGRPGKAGARLTWRVVVDVRDLGELARLLTGEARWGSEPRWIPEAEVQGKAPRWRALWARREAAMAAPWIIWRREGEGCLVVCRLRDVPAVADVLLGVAGRGRVARG